MIVVLDTNIVASATFLLTLGAAHGTAIVSVSDFLLLLGLPENPA
jgi:hypothetical protein